MSNAPSVLLGDVPAIRAFSSSSATETAVTVTKDDSGTIFVDKSSNHLIYDLPTVAESAGKIFWFINAGTGNMSIRGGTVDRMIALNDGAADYIEFSTSGQKTGAAVMVTCDGTYYFPFVMTPNISTQYTIVTVGT